MPGSRKALLAAALLLTVVIAAPLAYRSAGREELRAVATVRPHAGTGAPEAPERVGGQGRDHGRVMIATVYDRSLAGSPTASGEPFDPEAYTAAHRSLPLGTKLRVSRGGESVRVTVNDRGPFTPGLDIDLSPAAAREIGLTQQGPAPVRVEVL